MDLRKRLGLEAATNHEPMNVIMRFGSELLSLEVDSVGDVLACSKTMLLAAPPTLAGHWKDICQQVLQMEKGLMLAVSIEKIFGFNSSKKNEENA
jgi:chemotaxis signal transduction protein